LDKPGWLQEVMDSAQREVQKWPKWQREGVESVRVEPTTMDSELLEALAQFLAYKDTPHRWCECDLTTYKHLDRIRELMEQRRKRTPPSHESPGDRGKQ